MDLKQKNWIMLILALVLVAGSWALFSPPAKKITMGLDIQGGLSVILTAQPSAGQTLTTDMMDNSESIIRNRVDGLGVKEASVQRQGADSLLIQVPGISDPQAALKVLGETGQLEFVDVSSITDTTTLAAVQAGDKNVKLKDGTFKAIELNGVKLNGGTIKDSTVSQDTKGNIVVDLTMDSDGTKVWADYTSKNIGKQVAVVLDGTVKSAPAVQSAITTGKTEISGSFTTAEAKSLRTVLISGSLPVTLAQSEARIVGPTLGQDSLNKGVLAGMIGLILVGLYVIGYYRGLGVVTASALVVFSSLFMGVLAIMSKMGVFSLTLPGIAGVVLTIGMAADSSILINERYKEEVRIGKSIQAAADSGTLHGMKTSIDADMVSLVSAVVLYMFAAGSVKGFALTLGIGICCDILMMVLYKRPILILTSNFMSKAPKVWGLSKPAKDEKGGGAHA
ncbi:MAG: protein translocase subunit SecD [Coriobacteriia bacterium]|nr:protein translocase subunit SecD [Coriobacteriia bacterium]